MNICSYSKKFYSNANWKKKKKEFVNVEQSFSLQSSLNCQEEDSSNFQSMIVPIFCESKC